MKNFVINNINLRILKNNIFKYSVFILTILSAGILLLIIFILSYKSKNLLFNNPISNILLSSNWQPTNGSFGLLSFIISTIYVSLIAIIIAAPISLFSSILISQYMFDRIKTMLCSLIDILAGIPSIIYGMWGVFVLVPLIKKFIAPIFGIQCTGYSILTSGILLAVMLFPIIIQLNICIIDSVPYEMKEASLVIGATKWQTIKYVVLKKSLPGFIAALILGISRALGETMAVILVLGNTAKIPANIFSPGYTLTALIANTYGEMMTIPDFESVIMLSALLLLILVLFFNILARIILIKIKRSM